MRLLDIALKDIKIILRDYKALALIIAMPIILILILGAALGPMMDTGSRISPFKVAVVDLDGGEIPERLMEVFVSDKVRELIITESVGSEEDARDMIINKKAAAAIVIPDGLSLMGSSGRSLRGIRGRDTKVISVLGDPGDSLRVSIVKGIIETFTKQYSLVYVGSETIIEGLIEEGVANNGSTKAKQNWDFLSLGRDIGKELVDRTLRVAHLFSQKSEESGWVSAFQYYTAGMTMMFVLFGAMQGVQSILEERENRTLMRLFSTQASKFDVIAGKTLGTLLICLLQILVLILFTSYIYGIDWGDSMLGVGVLSIAVAFAATGFVMFLAAMAKTKKTADGLQNIGIQFMAFLGGCTFPIYVFPDSLRTISRVTVTWWGLEGYLQLMLGNGVVSIVKPLLILFLMGLVYMVLGIWKLRLD